MAYPSDPRPGVDFEIKDSGERQQFAGGMVRDTSEGKIDWLNLSFGPLYRRIAEHLTRGRVKYPDPQPGVPNWTLAAGREEALRAKQSAARHFDQWLNGDTDEDHAAATAFNMNLFEYLREKDPTIPAGFGTQAGLLDDSFENIPVSDVPASKPWHIDLPDAEEREGKWTGTLGFTAPAYFAGLEESTPRPLQPGDTVRVITVGSSFYNKTGVILGLEADSFYPVCVRIPEWETGVVFQHSELELVEPACNSNCLDCDC